jgi:hypothetical protein
MGWIYRWRCMYVRGSITRWPYSGTSCYNPTRRVYAWEWWLFGEPVDRGPNHCWWCSCTRLRSLSMLCCFFIYGNTIGQFMNVLGLRFKIYQCKWLSFSNHCSMLNVIWLMIKWFEYENEYDSLPIYINFSFLF